jgi:hypothetical protein
VKWFVVPPSSICILTLTIAMAAATGTQVSSAQQAPGQPIFDCTGAQARYDQLNSGLAVQQDALKRSEDLLNNLRRERTLGTEEAKKQEAELAKDQLQDSATEILKEEVTLRAKLQALQAVTGSKAVSEDLLREMGAINQQLGFIDAISQGLTHLKSGYKAGQAYNQQIQNSAHSLQEHIVLLNKLLTDSGIYNDAGNALGEALLGPAGPLAFKGVVSLVDATVQSEANFDLLLQEQNAADTVNTLRQQVDNIQDKMGDLKANCLNQPPASSNPANPPSDTTLSNPPAPPTDHTGAVLLIGGLGAAGVAAYAVGEMYNPANKTSSGSGGGSGQCNGLSPKNACGSCTSDAQCGGSDDCWTGGGSAPFC